MTRIKNIKPQLNANKKVSLRLKKSVIIITLAAIILSLWAVYADIIILRKTEDMTASENAISVLFVGNSHVFVGNLPQQLQKIAGIHDVEIIYKDISRHGNRGGTLSELSTKAIDEMQKYKFDYVVIQVGRSFDNLDGIKSLCEAAKENGTVPLLYNSAWAYIDGKPNEERLSVSTEISRQAADENDAVLVNVADAWIFAYQEIPEISLCTKFDPRGPHANKAGGFFTACVFAATIFDLHIKEIPNDNLYKGNDAIDLAQTAWKFVHAIDSVSAE